MRLTVSLLAAPQAIPGGEIKVKKKKGGWKQKAREEELGVGVVNMASSVGCQHYVRSCLLKVSKF